MFLIPINLSIAFVLLYILAITVTLLFSLSLGYFLATRFWSWGKDPDMYALPILSSIVDVFGQLMLAMAFEGTRWINGQSGNEKIIEEGTRAVLEATVKVVKYLR
jgi:solute carrier family 41